ncbi:hypothetical protein BDB00DRAFT_858701 [Zychaea mexicana]|uniref:uncharacterized protein n=1 Tax=Zychaea mexicana TaxID=64656 RepID=UPI0022FE88A8|nr:uncharacterized protein BDB00DRAFT_858701 [Zychaea mexicana]KAI9479527.1 hypothetical protein BDB00DRAFT_858701 [Zychaea mexicana]
MRISTDFPFVSFTEDVSTGRGNDAWSPSTSRDDRGEGSIGDSIEGCSDVIVAFSLPFVPWNENVVLDVVRVCDLITVSLWRDVAVVEVTDAAAVAAAPVSSANLGRSDLDASVTHNVGADCFRIGVGGNGLLVPRSPSVSSLPLSGVVAGFGITGRLGGFIFSFLRRR